MPTYEYRCENGHNFEIVQRMTEDPVSSCTVCGASVKRVFHPVAVHFKGSGFYNTDYGTRKRSKEKENGGGEGKSESASSTGSSDGGGSDSSSSSSSDGKSSGGESSKSAESKKSDAKPKAPANS